MSEMSMSQAAGDAPASPAPLPGRGRIRGLDGIRAVAVASVFCFHSFALHLHGGWLGVDLFFALSGFLITFLLVTESDRLGRIGLGRFYLRRALRLFPALAVLFAGLILFFVLRPSQIGSQTEHFMRYVVALVPNWELVRHDPTTTGIGAQSVIGSTWSLGVEEQFYLLWPLLLILLMRIIKSRRTIGYVVAILAVSDGAYQFIAWKSGLGSLRPGSQALRDRLYYGSDAHASGLLLGCAAALFLVSAPRRLEGVAGSARGTLLLRVAAAASVIFVAFVDYQGMSNGWEESGGEFAIGLAGALIVWCVAAGAAGGWAVRVLELRPVAYLGRISYGFYLWSFPILIGITIWHNRPYQDAFTWSAEFVATLACAAASFHLVERPLSRLRRRARQ
jgi:peptidoglycan/LPS O-acetylase OafA/YrhL